MALNASAVPAPLESGVDCTVESPTSVCGAAAAATVNDCVAGVASTLPAASMARTAMACMPSVRAFVVHGLVHRGPTRRSRSRHWNAAPLSLAVKAKVGVLSVVVPVGPDVIVVFGAVVSAGGACCRRLGDADRLHRGGRVAVGVGHRDAGMFLRPASWKVNGIVLPLPSGHWSPVGPSGPSSCQP